MNNSPVNASSDFSIEQTELEKPQNVINSPLLASICVAICIFSSIIALFFGVWIRLIYTIFDGKTADSLMYVYSEIWVLVDRGVFLNLVILATACFAGYLFIGTLNKWIGIISLLVSVFFVLLYLIHWLPHILGIDFMPVFLVRGLIGNMALIDVPFIIWLFLNLLIIPIIFLIGSLKTKTIPVWNWLVLVVIPILTCIFGLFPAFFFGGIKTQPLFIWLSWGMSVWVLFAVVIFADFIRTKVSKTYIWLTLALSIGAVGLSLIVVFTYSFFIYQRAIENKKRTGLENRKTEIAVSLERTF